MYVFVGYNNSDGMRALRDYIDGRSAVPARDQRA
jgi:hypothetical protein